jgi:hypothetical protein
MELEGSNLKSKLWGLAESFSQVSKNSLVGSSGFIRKKVGPFEFNLNKKT